MEKIHWVLISIFVAIALTIIFGKQIEECCGGRASYFMEPPNSGEACLHPYLFCGVKTGGHPGENWIL